MYGLVDCNNFFVSCERTLDPSLLNRAVVVLSNNDGCVVARSNEAKRAGIKMGQPAFEIRDQIMRGDVIALSGNHLLYRAISLRLHDIFRHYAPRTIDYSIDESFLDMEGIPERELSTIGEEIVKICQTQENMPVTIGFAPTKTLCKLATEKGKKSGKEVVTLFDQSEQIEIMSHLAIRELWGIGRRLAKRLYLKGIYTIHDFYKRDLLWVRGELGVNGERSWRELHGESCIEMEHLEHTIQDTISETRTFPTDINDYDYLRSRITMYSSNVARRLRAMNGEAGSVSVFLCTNRFHIESGYFTPSSRLIIDPPSSDTGTITSASMIILDRIYDMSLSYKRAGVILADIRPSKSRAPGLFDDEEQQKADIRSKRLMQAIDKINPNVGPKILKLATELNISHLGHNDGYSSSFGPAKKY